MTVSAASLAKADARFADTNLIRLSDDMMPHILEAMVLKARTAKVAINKLSEKQITDAIFETKAALEANDINEAAHDAGEVPTPAVVDEKPLTVHQVKHIQKQHGRNVRAAKVAQAPAEAPVKAKQIHTSHEGCSHASTKVARATCRRERARAAKA